MITPDKQAELLMDHYKDSFQLALEHWKTRNRLFIFTLVTLTLMLFQLTSPNVLEHLANSYIQKQVESEPAASVPGTATEKRLTAAGSSNPSPPNSEVVQQREAKGDLVDFRFITSLLWFLLAYLLVQYYQRSILVDRQYIYLDGIEKKINKLIAAGFVTREGFSYHKDRPEFLKRVKILYSVIFLLLMGLVVLGKIVRETIAVHLELPGLASKGKVTAVLFIFADFVIAVVIGYYTVLYVQWLRRPPAAIVGSE